MKAVMIDKENPQERRSGCMLMLPCYEEAQVHVSRILLVSAFGQNNEEFGFSSGHGTNRNISPVSFDGALDDRESQTRAFDGAVGVILVHSIKAFEDKRKMIRGNANAIITDADLNLIVDDFSAHRDL
jgi:hypothetical protein